MIFSISIFVLMVSLVRSGKLSKILSKSRLTGNYDMLARFVLYIILSFLCLIPYISYDLNLSVKCSSSNFKPQSTYSELSKVFELSNERNCRLVQIASSYVKWLFLHMVSDEML